jgi:hypothetical protein
LVGTVLPAPQNCTPTEVLLLMWYLNEWFPSEQRLVGTDSSVVAVMPIPPDQPSVVFDSKFQLVQAPQENWLYKQ